MIRGLKVLSPKKSATGMDGGHTYLSGFAEWKGRKTPVFVFLKDEAEEKKIEEAVLDSAVTFDAPRHDFVVGHGLSLFEAELR
jgi:hypothetical protein